MGLQTEIETLTGGVRLARLILQERRVANNNRAAGLTKLAGLVGSIKDSDNMAGGLAKRLNDAVMGLNTEMSITTGLIQEVETTRDHLRALNQAVIPGSNGGPPLASEVSSVSTVSSQPGETANLGAVK